MAWNVKQKQINKLDYKNQKYEVVITVPVLR